MADQPSLPTLGISNSEVTTWSVCQQRWFYEHHPYFKVHPKSDGNARIRGVIGHKSLEMFYLQIKEGATFEEAKKAAINELMQELLKAEHVSNQWRSDTIALLLERITGYLDYYKSDIDNWEILGVEKFGIILAPGENFYLPIKLDLIVRWKDGTVKFEKDGRIQEVEMAGHTTPIDHKFSADAWPEIRYEVNSQIPLQIRAARQEKYPELTRDPVIMHGVVNFIRTRDMKWDPEKLFQRRLISPNPRMYEKVFQNHIKAARLVEARKRMGLEEARELTVLANSGEACKYCEFKSLCAAELKEVGFAEELEGNYTDSDYGYPALEDIGPEGIHGPFIER